MSRAASCDCAVSLVTPPAFLATDRVTWRSRAHGFFLLRALVASATGA
ncbi:hypothetical protein PF004_g31019 [Phytophthora fragariae]|uniref:Uncharacterized protein n=1 Tax=Phytophthora fragariae TaxID=53985 RepID=A0A6G0MA96_9STRA|nr:hypothetical protein PF004_g31019 [Phytophthora fragariae]